MRKSVILLLAAAIVAWNCPAFAVEGLNWGVGLKGWYNSMEEKPPSGSSVKSKDPALMIGPNVKASYKGFFAGTSYLFTTSDYKFEVGGVEFATSNRKDFDLLGGYMFIPYAGAFLGYKNIKQDVDVLFGNDWTNKFSLGALGLTGNYPLPQIPLTFYANAAYLWGTWKQNVNGGGDFSSDASGYAIEGGAAYRIWQGLSAGLGYKHQELTIKEKLPSVEKLKYRFTGFTASVDYNF